MNKKVNRQKEEKDAKGAYLHREPQLVVELRDQEVMAQSLAHLHNPDNGCVNLVLPILEHSLLGVSLFLNLSTQVESYYTFISHFKK